MFRQHDHLSSACARLLHLLSFAVSSRDWGSATSRSHTRCTPQQGGDEASWDGRTPASRPCRIREHQRERLARCRVDGRTLAVRSLRGQGCGLKTRRGKRMTGRKGGTGITGWLLHYHTMSRYCVSATCHTAAVPGHSEVVKLSPSISKCSRMSRTPYPRHRNPPLEASSAILQLSMAPRRGAAGRRAPSLGRGLRHRTTPSLQSSQLSLTSRDTDAGRSVTGLSLGPGSGAFAPPAASPSSRASKSA